MLPACFPIGGTNPVRRKTDCRLEPGALDENPDTRILPSSPSFALRSLGHHKLGTQCKDIQITGLNEMLVGKREGVVVGLHAH